MAAGAAAGSWAVACLLSACCCCTLAPQPIPIPAGALRAGLLRVSASRHTDVPRVPSCHARVPRVPGLLLENRCE